MHPIVDGLLKEFSNSFELSEKEESKKLEYLVNYLITSQNNLRIDPRDITSADDDAGLDGISILIDDQLVTSIEEVADMFEVNKKRSIKIILTQVKSSEQFRKEEVASFGQGVAIFLDEQSTFPQGEFNQLRKEILFYIFNHPGKIKNNRPDIEIYFCTTGSYKAEQEIAGSIFSIKTMVESLSYFNNVTVEAIDTEKIIKLKNTLDLDYEAKIEVQEYFPIMESSLITSSFLALVNAKEFIDKLIINEEKQDVKSNIFDENIRSFLGSDTPVNDKIHSSLQNDENRKIFSILNNGITVIASELAYSNSKKIVDITNYQIINGCQTSNVLFLNKDLLDDECSIIVKFIQTDNRDIINKIIASTNSQTYIEDNAFLSLNDKTRMVQAYFNAKNQVSNEKIYFERRINEYKDMPAQSSRIFDLKLVSRAYNAMFLNNPHSSSRYINKIFEGDKLFKSDDAEGYYYIATLCLYKINSLINSKKFNHPAFLKWHFLYSFKYLALKKVKGFEPNSNKARKNIEEMCKILMNKKSFEALVSEFDGILSSIPDKTSDSVKRQKFSQEIKALILKEISKNSGS